MAHSKRLLIVLVTTIAVLLGWGVAASAATPTSAPLSSLQAVDGDEDDDGVPDDQDACPGTPATTPVDAAGCPLPPETYDADGDGVLDHEDACPSEAGLPQFQGCPDSDGDGYPDNQDPCPHEYGDYGGCPGSYDMDGDGIPDTEDWCPMDPGPWHMNGCPDSDGDSIADGEDACPFEAGDWEYQGCPASSADTDGDGVTEDIDECHYDFGTVANNGCPELVTVPAPTFTNPCGSADDMVTIPAADGLTYLVDGTAVSSGSHPAGGTVTVFAVPDSGYVTGDQQLEWSSTYTNAPCQSVGRVVVSSPAKDRVRIVNRETSPLTFIVGSRRVSVAAKGTKTVVVIQAQITWRADWQAPRLLDRTGRLRVK